VGNRQGGRTPDTDVIFEDQAGESIRFRNGSAENSIVVFFYTRCDNPLKFTPSANWRWAYPALDGSQHAIDPDRAQAAALTVIAEAW